MLRPAATSTEFPADFPADEAFWIESAQWNRGNLTLRLGLVEGEASRRWLLRCDDPVENQFELCEEGELAIHAEHSLVAHYNEPKYELHFSGRTDQTDAVCYRLLMVNRRLLDGVGDPFRFLRGGPDDFLHDGFGLIAIGPKSIFDQYAAVLRDAGLKASVTRAASESWAANLSEHQRKLALLTLGGSYVLAHGFQVSPAPPALPRSPAIGLEKP